MSDLLPDMREADAKLKNDLVEAFSKLPLIPEAIVSSIHSAGYAEDGSFLLMLDLVDGGTMFVSAAPLAPLRVVVEPHPH